MSEHVKEETKSRPANDLDPRFFPKQVVQDAETESETNPIRKFLCHAYTWVFGDNLPSCEEVSVVPGLPCATAAVFGLGLPSSSGGSVTLVPPDCADLSAYGLNAARLVLEDAAVSVSQAWIDPKPTIRLSAPESESLCIALTPPLEVHYEPTTVESSEADDICLVLRQPRTTGIRLHGNCESWSITIPPFADPLVHREAIELLSPCSSSVAVVMEDPDSVGIDLVIPPPQVNGTVFVRFEKRSLREAGKATRESASRRRNPDDPFTALFFLLLPSQNWDCRILDLDELLAAYPPNSPPYPFQLEGIKFLSERQHALLADEMGLGKTIQAILAFRALIHSGQIRRVLVVCPKSLLATWEDEVARWAPELSVTTVHGSRVEKATALLRPHHVYITNYETVTGIICDATFVQRVPTVRPFELLVIDEGQHLKNPTTKKAKAVVGVCAERRWCLTGTPLENSFDDYRAVWWIIAPNERLERLSNAAFQARTRVNVLRREKRDVLKDLPEKFVQVERVQLDDRQRRRYEELLSGVRSELRPMLGTGDQSLRMHVFEQLNKLKQVCIYDERSTQSSKMDWIMERLNEINPKGVSPDRCEKALIFTQYPKLVFDKWGLHKKLAGYGPGRYDASIPERERVNFPERFQTDEGMRVAIVGLKAAGTGLTLTRANHVVFLDSWWNPAVMDQAAARIHRIGQKRACFVTSLVACDTVDERILDILNRKKRMFEQVMADLKSGKRTLADLEQLQNCLTLEDMLEALGLRRAK